MFAWKQGISLYKSGQSGLEIRPGSSMLEGVHSMQEMVD